MSDNVNVNSDVIIDAEFVPKTIIAEKELPAVTSADYEKILQVDENGNWVAVRDKFHVGDSCFVSPAPFTLIKNTTMVIGLPKVVDSSVKWFNIEDSSSIHGVNSRIVVVDEKGDTVVPFSSNKKLDDVFNYSIRYSSVDINAIKLENVSLKEPYATDFPDWKMLHIMFYATWVDFLNAKPTT